MKNKFSIIKKSNNHMCLRFVALLIANVFICWNIQPAVFGGNLKPYYVYNSSPTGFGGNWDFKSNDDGKNTITLVKCLNNKETELKSPISSYDVTRVEDNFSVVKKTIDRDSIKDGIKNITKEDLVSLIPLSALSFIAYLLTPNAEIIDLFPNNIIYSNITSVDLSKCISVGESAFKGNENLVNVNLPECTAIGTSAFKNDKNLTNVNVSKNYKTVEPETFKDCTKLSSIPNEEFLEELGHYSFTRTGLKKINLESCKDVEYGCFNECNNLISANLPSCMHVGQYCFRGCKNLLEVNLPNCICLDREAFLDCSSLIELDLPNVQEIKARTFSDCSKLESIYLPKCKKISSIAFVGWTSPEIESCKSLKKIVVPKDCIIEEGALPKDKIKCIQRI